MAKSKDKFEFTEEEFKKYESEFPDAFSMESRKELIQKKKTLKEGVSSQYAQTLMRETKMILEHKIALLLRPCTPSGIEKSPTYTAFERGFIIGFQKRNELAKILIARLEKLAKGGVK